MTNKPWLLALNRINAIGPRTIMALLKRWPRLEDMFQLSHCDLVTAGLTKNLAQAIHDFDMADVTADLDWEKAPNHHVLTWEDPDYPSLLKEIHDPPAVLYAAGDLQSLKHPMLAMVGTRKPSITGRETAHQFARQLASLPITIVSGLAHGIDAAAHLGCLAANGRTIAVMGTGMDCIYPRSHSNLASKISENGLLLTEFPLKISPRAGHFPRRNRIISGLSLATLVVEAALKSGSLITARLALEQNRDVLAIPGSIHNAQATGCHHLLQQGARLVTCTQDVLDELKIEMTLPEVKLGGPSIASHIKNLVQFIGFEMTTIDQMIHRSGFGIEKVASELAQLELQGVVKAIPGGYIRNVPL